jgi:DNA-binding transcriptional regulator YhcF (GntR family)
LKPVTSRRNIALDIVLNRRGGVPVREQLATQLELKIMGGDLGPGQRLPSVRALARRLNVHPNTVSAAYQDLTADGRVELRRGSGVFVRAGGPGSLPEASDLDDMIRLALRDAYQKGFTGEQVRAAVERWLQAAPPQQIVVVDSCPEMAEVIAHELRQSVATPVRCCGLADLPGDGSLAGSLVLTLPHHRETIARRAPGAAIEVVNVAISPKDREAILAVPQGAVVLVVSHAPSVLPVASVFLRSLRGDEVLAETHLVTATRAWRRLLPAADLVFADAISVKEVGRGRPRRIREFRVLGDGTLARLREALKAVVPGPRAPARAG